MSTRATIAVRRADGYFGAAYLHLDGYPSHTGETLKQHFATQQLAEGLVAGGDLRCMDRKTGEAEHYDGEHGPAKLPTRNALIVFAQNCTSQFLYVFEEGAWSCEKL